MGVGSFDVPSSASPATQSPAAFLRLVVDAAVVASIVVDRAGHIVCANAQAGELFGYAPERLLERDIETLVPPRSRPHHPPLRDGFFSAPTSRPMGAGRDLFGLRSDDVEVPIEIGLKPIETADGLFVLAAIIDLTERKRAEEHQRLIIEAANAMIMVDARGKIAMVNTQAEQLFGYARGDLLGKPVDMLVPERLRAGHPVLRDAFLGRPTARPMGGGRDLFGLRKDGSEVPIEIGLNPLTTPEGQFVIAAIIDITERRRVEELRILNAGMEQHNKQLAALNAELESFSYSVSHDLRAPVRAISGYSNALEEDYGSALDAEGRRLLAVVGAESARMGRLIDALLEFSRLGREPMRTETVAMTTLARDVAERYGAEGDVVISVGELPPVRGDVTLLRQVWENLISNAVKYSQNSDEPAVVVSGESENGTLRYSVADNGVGFDMRYAAKLYGVFQRLHHDDEFTGTGVGLATVKRIVERHGGQVWATGEVGRGARFCFSLPAHGA